MNAGVLLTVIGTLSSSAIAISVNKQKILRAFEPPPYQVSGPLVSVIVPALEEEKYIGNLLTSLHNQTYNPIEVIVVDQTPLDSEDRTQEICLQHGAAWVYREELSPSIARNEGAKLAQGEILIFSDADNILAHDCIEHLVDALEEGYILANPIQGTYDDNIGIYSFGTLIGNNIFKNSWWTTCCIAIWKDAFPGYNESCSPLEGCREDLQLGKDVLELYGYEATKLVRSALVGTSARRFNKQGLSHAFPWQERTIRKLLTNYY